MPSPSRSSHRPMSPPAAALSPDRRHHHSRHGDSHQHHQHHHHRHREDRSRSPHRSDRHKSDRRHHRRHDRDRERDGDRHERRVREPPASAQPVILPLQARELSRRDLEVYEPLFAMYLDIQKGLLIEDLNEEEVKGRWKSFVRKWNRGELAEGWYDPATLDRARRSAEEQQLPGAPNHIRAGSLDYTRDGRNMSRATPTKSPADENEEDEEYGPTLPHPSGSTWARDGKGGTYSGPTIPSLQDLDLKRETAIEDEMAARGESRQQHRAEVRSHKSAMRHLEDEIAPRAEPGTRERQLEKRREAAAANRSFAEARRGGSPEAAPDEELIGSGDNDLAALKQDKEKEQRKKNEREIRREEILRARAAEREERVQKYRQKEEETIGWLQALAKQRFG